MAPKIFWRPFVGQHSRNSTVDFPQAPPMASLLFSLIASTAFGPLATALKIETLETLDFNVTAALETHGIFASEVPGLRDHEEDSASDCPSAVCQ